MTGLPNFTFTQDGETDLWPETPDLPFAQATALGRQRAAELVDVIRRRPSDRPLLGFVMEAIMEGGRYGGVEIGFFKGLADELAAPSNTVTEFIEVPAERSFRAGAQIRHLRSVAGCGAA